MAQRVMDCGDAGHILLSKHVADDLEQYPRWRPLLHDLGECEVKHGVRVSAVNLYTEELGNPQMPEKFKKLTEQKQPTVSPATVSDCKRRRNRRALIVAVIMIAGALAVGVSLFLRRPSAKSASAPAATPVASAMPTVPAVLEKSIAVLPFENLSEEKANAYFAEGMQDEILTRLAAVRDLKVISRTSTAKYQSKPDNLKIVAQELGVATILEGAVQKAGDKVRVNVQLIDAHTDTHLWAKSYDRDLKDVLGVESEVSQEIADALKANLSPGESHALASTRTRDTEAYDLFLRGEYEFRQAQSNPIAATAYDRADAFYRQALATGSKFCRGCCRARAQPAIAALVRLSFDGSAVRGGEVAHRRRSRGGSKFTGSALCAGVILLLGSSPIRECARGVQPRAGTATQQCFSATIFRDCLPPSR